MKLLPLPLEGAHLVEWQPTEDERGAFGRCFCREALVGHGIAFSIDQVNVSDNVKAGTLRGLHYQEAPFAEGKIVVCLAGAVYDVLVDLRRESPTYRRWHGVELSSDRSVALYAPPGFAHGYQTLLDGTRLLYLMSGSYRPDAARGIRWDDPTLAIEWPAASRRILSAADLRHPRFNG